MMKAIILYESLTGTTKLAGEAIAAVLRGQQWEASACPITNIDMQGLANADLVIVGSWTDGIFLFGQKPARPARLRAMPSIEGKVAAVYCTYAIDPGKTLEKLSGIVAGKGADVLGGYAIHRKDVQAGAVEFVARALSQLEIASPTSSLESALEQYSSGVAQL